jgi:hypothetical protein
MTTTEYMQGPVVPVGSILPLTADVALTININNPTTSLVATTNDATEINTQRTNLLIAYGEYYAIQLTRVLDVLATYHQDAIEPIMSILDPYIEPIPVIDFHIPPKSSREIEIEIFRE